MSDDNLASKFYEGKPCRKCGSTKRYVKSKCCVDCAHKYVNQAYQVNPERVRKRVHEWRKENPEKVKSWQQENSEKDQESSRKWRQNNPEKYRESMRISRTKQRANRRQAEGFHSTKQWVDLNEQYGHHCLDCKKHKSEFPINPRTGRQRPVEPDHIVPLSRGGTNWIWNIQPLCHDCNRKNWHHYLKTGAQINFRNHLQTS
jgi:hypothetical protein